ncbi:MAG: DUF2924 domain-containing protein [Candidatus Binatus sp.]|uniref:DUF2924 domain-containing protein n=1 Tax=Candidatus Binatus sp. TaxID=2811406 RepID=UPI002723A801|nr:DUF2924 domain-containing protein [Candidatus Binatus sp.]MDO8430926.1 DUF2924 domain-containing protein [Candidatus Binatus sp.]
MAIKNNQRASGSRERAGDPVGLSKLATDDLRERWRQLYGAGPPARINRPLLIRGIGYRLQENAHGGLKPATHRLLERVVEAAVAGLEVIVTPKRSARPGTMLVREWHGITHQVTVLDEGVLYAEQRYRSLSEVARLITGCRWSGPLFFGLRSIERNHAAR